MGEQVKKWYVVRAVSGKEKKVKEYIESEINRLGLQEFVSQVLIPTEKVYQVRKGKKISKERNYFPGYVLVEAALVGEITHIIRNIPNVLGFLGTGNEPSPDDEVQNRFELQEMRDALQFLTDEQQQVLILRFISGLSTENVAEIMDKREGAIRALQMRALQTLSKYMMEKEAV